VWGGSAFPFLLRAKFVEFSSKNVGFYAFFNGSYVTVAHVEAAGLGSWCRAVAYSALANETRYYAVATGTIVLK